MNKEYNDLTLEELNKHINEYFYGKELPKDRKSNAFFEMRNFKWEENGEKFSAWEIKTPNGTMHTGDGGADLFTKCLKEAVEKEMKEYEKEQGNLGADAGRK